jgi:hypothetical protein
MTLAAPPSPSARWTVRLLALACVLLALICLGLATAWRQKANQVGCLRDALADGTTPAVADIDCGVTRSR